jgi:lipoprotein NlpI
LIGALADLNQSISLDPKNAEAYCNFGLVYLTQSKDTEANANFTKCYQLDGKLKAGFEKMAGELKKK